jgi:tetratricopeptide (TPR) repeat protein
MAQQQEPVKRRVALKIVKLGMDTKQVVARFEAERQALALMDHPNIAKILDAGATETGRPYFVMELVKGIRITEYCDQNNVSPRERLELFVQICRAVQHAHQKGIIHRDIKPSNILVTLHDGVPVPKIIDFGIAKATQQELAERTVFTQFGQFIGTPAYMSPEQAEMSGLDIDTRSDIYSLGVLLYELLTGKTPFDPKELVAAGLEQMRRTLREQEPARPSTRLSTLIASELTLAARHRRLDAPKLLRLVRGDLDWIVMKCLEKDRTRRYETASRFADDIEHFLRSEPISARPPSQLYRFRRLVLRNKVGFAAASAVALAVVAGLVVSTYLYFREKQARIRSQQVALFLKDMLEGVGPAVAKGRDTALLRDILDRTVERVAKDLRNEPEVEAELCNTIGEVYRALGQYADAEKMHRGARAMQRKVAPKNPAVETSLSDLALALTDRGMYSEAEALDRQVLELRRKRLGGEHPEVAAAMNTLAIVLRKEGKPAEAEPLHRQALTIQRRPGEPELPVATSLNNLGLTLRDEGKLSEAESSIREALEIQQKVSGKADPAVAITMDNLAFVLLDQGKVAAAEAQEREALEMVSKFFNKTHPFLATAQHNLALILTARGQFAEAEKLHREALAIRRNRFGQEHPEVAGSLDSLGLLLRKLKRLSEAESMEQEALAIRKKFFGDESLAMAGSLNSVGLVLHAQGKLPEAEGSFRQALAMQKRFLGPEHPWEATTLNNLAQVLRDSGRSGDAEQAFRQALAMREKWLGPQHPLTLASRKDLNDVLGHEATARDPIPTGDVR